tara:strand:+ start:3749 stop:3931 length:183 start_codon:yes stop_codon:yes gene_type:complete
MTISNELYNSAKIERAFTESRLTVNSATIYLEGKTVDEWIDYVTKQFPGWELACVGQDIN